ncbi:MAG: prolipoprotein diacylglyceryl transferase [Planctomycetota bacterium]
MRTHLLRIVLDHAWRLTVEGNELYVGVGWFVAFWMLVLLLGWAWLALRSGHWQEAAVTVGFWMIVPIGLLMLYWLQPQVKFMADGIPIFGYGFMMFVGFSVAAWLASARVMQIGQHPDIIWDMLMWALVPGLIGARVYYLWRHGSPEFATSTGLHKLVAAISLWDGGIVFYGSVLGGAVGIVSFCRWQRIPIVPMLDVMAPSLLVGEAFGRIGCFLYGCCYGGACSLPWAVRFPPDSLTFQKMLEKGQVTPDDPATPLLHPTQLYSSLAAFLLAWGLSRAFQRRQFDGFVLCLFAIFYPITRSLLELLRTDIDPYQSGLKDAQIFSLVLLLAGSVGMYYFSRHRRLTQVSVDAPQSGTRLSAAVSTGPVAVAQPAAAVSGKPGRRR